MSSESALVAGALFCLASSADAATLYVAKSGSDAANNCQTAGTPCATITHGIAQMAGGDTLLVGDGTYAETVKDIPSGTASAYTTVQAANDWGVTIDASGFPNDYKAGIGVAYAHYVTVRGFHVKMSQASDTNQGIGVISADHVKIQRCSVAYAGTFGNVSAIGVGPAADYVLIEESYAYGGARYPFLVYQSTHTVMRRNVSRIDYWHSSLQAANFANYNGDMTVWENNIAIDSDHSNVTGGSSLYAGFFNENKVPDSSWSGTATRETHRGNIVLNVQAVYSGIYDYDISNLHTYSDDIVWDSWGGYYADYIHGDAPVLDATRFTIGKISGKYDSGDGQGSGGSGVYVGSAAISNTITGSVLWHNPWLGIADYAVSDYNSFFDNGHGNYGGSPQTPAAGAHDHTEDLTAGLKYLPRVEAGSALATAGVGGGQAGADVQYMWGKTGTLWGEDGYDSITSDFLWPFPNEDVIKADMASYSGPGAAGVRGFTAGNSLNGTAQTLTKYIWEYLGNQIPDDIHSGGATPAPPVAGGSSSGSGSSSGATPSATKPHSGCRASGRGDVAGLLLVALFLARRRD